jgi:ferredoxin
VVSEVAEISSSLCQGCGLCAAECPGNAIVMAGYAADALCRDVDAALERGPSGVRRLVVFVSGHHAPSALWNGRAECLPAGAAEIYLPSLTRLSAAEMLYPFERGADGVLVLQCARGADRYPGVDERLVRRFEQARGLLVESGVPADRLELRFGLAGEEAASAAAIEEMMVRLDGRACAGEPSK